MYKGINVEAEHNELILKNSHGDHVIIPANKRDRVKELLKNNRNDIIDLIVNKIPVASKYAEFGSVFPEGGDESNPSVASNKTSTVNTKEKLRMLEDKMKSKKHLSWQEGLDYAIAKGMTGKEMHEFALSPKVDNGWKMTNPKYWNKEAETKPLPTTEEDILNYRKHEAMSEALRTDPTFNALREHIAQQGYQPLQGSKPFPVTGMQIYDMAKKSKIPITENPDGTFTMQDDINTFTNTDQSFGKGRTFHKTAKYNKQTFGKGQDLVNDYEMVQNPTYSGRVPTAEDLSEYDKGNSYTLGLTPQNTVVPIAQFKQLVNGNQNTFYGAEGGQSEIDAYNKLKLFNDSVTKYKASPDYVEKTKNSYTGNNVRQRNLYVNVKRPVNDALRGIGKIISPD